VIAGLLVGAALAVPTGTGPQGGGLFGAVELASAPWVQGSFVVARRDATWWGANAWIRGGVTTPSGVRLGVEVDWGYPRPLPRLGEERTLQPVETLICAQWAAGGPWSPILTAMGGVSVRRYEDSGELVANTVIPVIGIESGVAIPVWGDRIALVPVVRVFGDLRRTEIRSGGVPVQQLAAWEMQGGLSLMVPPPRSPE
jgi:hypothetical protein